VVKGEQETSLLHSDLEITHDNDLRGRPQRPADRRGIRGNSGVGLATAKQFVNEGAYVAA
jgi:hypothetical protein